MKTILLASLLALSGNANAWISHDPTVKTYSFRFKLKGETFKVDQKAPSYEDAFKEAAQTCFSHFKGGKRLSENEGLDIIDVCANPRAS